MNHYSSYETLPVRLRMKRELVNRLSEFRFDYFVTLATNHSTLSQQAMRDRLKIWLFLRVYGLLKFNFVVRFDCLALHMGM